MQFKDSLLRTLELLRPSLVRYRGRLVLGVLALLGVDGLQLVIPQILKSGVDRLASGQASQQYLARLGLVLVAIALIMTLLRFCWRYLIIGTSRLVERDLRRDIVHHVLVMDSAFLARNSTGSIMALCSNDLAAVQMACGIGLVAAVDALLMSSAAIACMLTIHPGLTVVAILPMPFLALLTRFLAGRLHNRFNAVQEQFARLTEFVRASISSIRLLKAYTLEQSQAGRFAVLGGEYVQASIRVAMIQGLLFPVSALAGSFGMLLLLFFGGRLVMIGSITLGDFIALTTYLSMLVWPITAIGWVANLAQRGLTSLKRIGFLLTARPELPPGVPGLAPVSASYSLYNLHFLYPGEATATLHAITMEIKPGILGICGPTGSGKSTLCQILVRLYPVAAGSVLFGGEDINRLQPLVIQSLVSYVSQEPVLFSGSIAENIAFGKPEASRAEVENAARAAAIHEEIAAFPEGYDSHIGERGVTLSGGQRQRVALARALLHDKPVLIVDDGLSAVDTVAEQAIMDSLASRIHGKTVIWVSQRVKQLARADRVVVLLQGKIDDLGTYPELLQRNHFIQSINRRQRLVESGGERFGTYA